MYQTSEMHIYLSGHKSCHKTIVISKRLVMLETILQDASPSMPILLIHPTLWYICTM
ncbi:hypothetical protein Hanom_Chr09g00848871 [Helianthus anomalus]